MEVFTAKHISQGKREFSSIKTTFISGGLSLTEIHKS